MVKILANGEIVQDNDSRAKQVNRPRQGNIQQVQHNDDDEQEQQYQGQGYDGQGPESVFDSLNQKLLDAGIPAFNLGEYVIQPIVTVGFLLAFILLGWRGIIFAGLLFLVNKLSQRPGGIAGFFRSIVGQRPNARRPGRPQGSNRRQPGSEGQRLGGQRLGRR